MSQSEAPQPLAFGLDVGSSLMEISRIHKTNDSFTINIVENSLGKKNTPYIFCKYILISVLIAFDKDKSYIGEIAKTNKVRCSPNYFTDINEMIAENEAKTFPYLQTSSTSHNYITMTCYEFYSLYMSQITNIIDPNILNKPSTENTFIEDVRAKGLPVAPSEVDDGSNNGFNSNDKSFVDLVQSSYASSSVDDLNNSSVLGSKDDNGCFRCVLAVPPYFNDKHVKNLLRLYKKFQPRYQIKIESVIPDYEALAICYSYENTINSSTEQIYLIVDMGYSHTSATVVQYTSNRCNILSSCYTRKICGKKIDELMSESIAKEIYIEGNPVNEQMAVDSVDSPNTPIFKDTATTVATSTTTTPKPDSEDVNYLNKFSEKVKTKIRNTMEEIKRKLSAQGADTINLSIEGGLPNDEDYEGIYSKEILDNLLTNNNYPDTLITLIKRAIKESNIGEEATIEGVIISGGSMRIPLLQETITKDLNMKLIQTLNMDESVANGCSAYWLNSHGLWNNYSLIGKLRDKTKEDEQLEEEDDDENRNGLTRVSNCINIDEDDKTILSPEMLDKNQLSSIETRINEILEFESKKNEIAAAKNKVEAKIYEQMLRTEFHEKVLDFMKKPMSGYLPLKFYTELEDYIDRGKEISLERLLEEVTNRPLPPMDELVNDCYVQLINDQYNKLNNIKINLPSATFIPAGEDGSDSLPKPYPALNRQEFDDLITKVRKSEIIFEDTMEKIRRSKVNTPVTGKDSEDGDNNNNNNDNNNNNEKGENGENDDDDENKSPLSRNMTKAELEENVSEDTYHRNENGELVDQDGNVIDESKYHLNEDGELEDEEGNIVDKNGKIIRKKEEKKIKRNKNGELEDEDGNIVDKDGNIIKKKENLGKHKRNEKGELVDEDGNVIDETKYHLNEDGVLVDENGNEVDSNGKIKGREKIIDENGNIKDPTKYRYNDKHQILDNDGNIVDEYGDIIQRALEGNYHRNEEGKLVDENGNVIDEDKFKLNENGELVDKDGNIVDSNGKITKKKENLGNYSRNEKGELIDKNGNVVDESKYRLNANGELVDKDGNVVDSEGKIIKKAKQGKYHRNKEGKLVDEDGNVIDESKYHLNENGLLEDENGNIVDKDGNIIVSAEEIRDKGINVAISGLNWDLWGSTLEPEPQYQPWPLMPQKPATAPELSPHGKAKKVDKNDPIQYLLKMEPSPALIEFLNQPNSHLTIENLKLFRKQIPLTPVTSERMNVQKPSFSSISPCNTARLFLSNSYGSKSARTPFRRNSHRYSNSKITLSTPPTPMNNNYSSTYNYDDNNNNNNIDESDVDNNSNNNVNSSAIPNSSFSETMNSEAPLDDTLNETSFNDNNNEDEYDEKGNLIFKRDETVEYYEEYNRSWIKARFATDVNDIYVEIVNHETGKKNVMRKHVRKYKPAKYEPGQIVHFISPYNEILMKRLGGNEAEVLKESNGKYVIRIKDLKYREVNANIFE